MTSARAEAPGSGSGCRPEPALTAVSSGLRDHRLSRSLTEATGGRRAALEVSAVTPTQAIPSTDLTRPTRASVNPGGDLGTRVREEGRRARLDEILLAVVVNALGPDARVAVAREEWVRVEDAIRGPVTTAATAALERLVADLEATLPRHLPELVRRIGADRLRAEFGFD